MQVTSPQSTEAQNNLWEHAYTGKTKADVSALSGASLLAMALKPNPQGLLAAHLAAVGGQTDLLFRIGDSATGSQVGGRVGPPGWGGFAQLCRISTAIPAALEQGCGGYQ